MSELYEKSLRKLELDQVLRQLSDCAGSAEGKETCPILWNGRTGADACNPRNFWALPVSCGLPEV